MKSPPSKIGSIDWILALSAFFIGVFVGLIFPLDKEVDYIEKQVECIDFNQIKEII